MSAYYKTATAGTYVFFLVQTASRPDGLTGASPSVTISKNGGAFAAVAATPAEIGNGFYSVVISATEFDARSVAIRATAASADDWNDIFLTDTILVSESVGSGLIHNLDGGDSVWTEAQRDRVLKQLSSILDAVRVQEKAAMESSGEIKALLSGIRTNVHDSGTTLAKHLSEVQSQAKEKILEALLHSDELQESGNAASKYQMEVVRQQVDAMLAKSSRLLLDEIDANGGRIRSVEEKVAECLRTLMFTLDSETLEAMAGGSTR